MVLFEGETWRGAGTLGGSGSGYGANGNGNGTGLGHGNGPHSPMKGVAADGDVFEIESSDGEGASSSAPTSAAGLAEWTAQAERLLLNRDFAAARDKSLAALDDMGYEDFATASGVRLGFVLGQALFELRELALADKTLRRVYGSFTCIPDRVVTLWLALLVQRGERECLERFTAAFIKVNQKRLGGVAGGAFLHLYLVDFLCELSGAPEKAAEWLDAHLKGKGDEALEKQLRKRVEAFAEERKEQERRRAEAEASGERDPSSGLALAGGEQPATGVSGPGQASSSSSVPKAAAAAGEVGASSLLGRLDTSQVVVAGAICSTFLYALYSERKSIRTAAGRAWSALTHGTRKFLLE
mmetsp:Transcript_3207/g.8063  ORF Transcript_3207/g.8063 Transcript_3207/m.8063 type:complete len:355 (-) Transcript_3207:69-1133(-)